MTPKLRSNTFDRMAKLNKHNQAMGDQNKLGAQKNNLKMKSANMEGDNKLPEI